MFGGRLSLTQSVNQPISSATKMSKETIAIAYGNIFGVSENEFVRERHALSKPII